MLPVVGYISRVRTSWNKTLKQPETVLAFVHDETEIKQNCRRSAVSFQPTVGSFVLFQFYFTVCYGLYCRIIVFIIPTNGTIRFGRVGIYVWL